MLNKNLNLALSLMIIVTFLIAANLTEAQDPVAHWSFDDVSGDTVPDSAGDNDGTIVGGVSVVAGTAGDALEFDGSGYVDIGKEVAELGSEDFSISVWIKTPENNIPILSKGNGAAWEQNEKELYIANSGTSEGPNDGTVEIVGWGVDWIRGSERVDDDQWHHVVVTWDVDPGEGHVYVDGTEGTHEVGYNGGGDNAGDTVRIGFMESGHSTGNFVGLMDDLQIYQRTLSADDVSALAQGPTAVESAGKLALTWGSLKASK